MKVLWKMKTKDKDKELQILEANQVDTDWRKNAEWRRANSSWLRYSRVIALKVLHRLDEIQMSQRRLAKELKCSPQYVSKLLKGNANMTLETIANLEKVLEIDLVKSSLAHIKRYETSLTDTEPIQQIAEPNAQYRSARKK